MSLTPAKDFLLKEKTLNLSEIANLMWPYNSDAKSYLRKKLNERGRTWTAADEANAIGVLRELGHRIQKLQ